MGFFDFLNVGTTFQKNMIDDTNVIDSYWQTIKDFDFARAYLFKVTVIFPGNIQAVGMEGVDQIQCYIKSTNVPEITIEEVSTFFMGQQFKQSSVRRFTDWPVTLYIDKNTSLLKAFYDWNKLSHSVEDNKYGDPENYLANQLMLTLLNPRNPTERTLRVKLYKVWPKTITNMALDYGTNDFITMDVTFSYQYYEMDVIQGITK
jgi:hypothetical protein